VRQVGYLQRLY